MGGYFLESLTSNIDCMPYVYIYTGQMLHHCGPSLTKLLVSYFLWYTNHARSFSSKVRHHVLQSDWGCIEFSARTILNALI